MVTNHPGYGGGHYRALTESDWVDHRHESRIVISIGLSVRERHCKSRSVELRDLSKRGCRVCDRLLVAGHTIWVTLDGLAAIEGIVTWSHKGEAGIRFCTPLHQAVLDHLVGAHSCRPAPSTDDFSGRTIRKWLAQR